MAPSVTNKAALDSTRDRALPVTRALDRPVWYPEHHELANLSPIVVSGSLRRQHGHVRLAALRQLARNGAIRVPPIETARRHSSLPREVLDRSLPPVPLDPVITDSKKPGHFAIKRKSVPGHGSLPTTPTTPSWVKQPLYSPWRVSASSPIVSQVYTTPRPVTSAPATPVAFHTPRQALSPLLTAPQSTLTSPIAQPREQNEIPSPTRTRLIPGARVKQAVEKIENITVGPTNDTVSTPVKALGAIVDKPCPISSAGLSAETRRIMAEARLRRKHT